MFLVEQAHWYYEVREPKRRGLLLLYRTQHPQVSCTSHEQLWPACPP
jgi:hypothetical protein